jgi:outer membrane immunogenic protein
MKKALGLVGTALLFAAPAVAADLAVKAPVYKAPPVPVYSWTGWYIGANGGYGWNNSAGFSEVPGDQSTAFVNNTGHHIVDPTSLSLSTKGGFGGAQLGYNWQFGRNWVAGIEADFDGADLKGSGSSGVNMAGRPNFGTLTESQKVEWFGTLRARLGVLLTNNLLLFATGGLAYGKVDEAANLGVTSAPNAIAFTNFITGFACSNPPGFFQGFPGGPTCFAGSQSSTRA